MPRAAPRSRRKEDRPAELLDAALDTFRSRGFAATRMEDIAAAAGVAKGTIYLYYPSKQAIFEALVRDRLLPNLAQFKDMLDAAPPRAAARLRALAEGFAGVSADPRIVAIPRLVLAEAASFPELARFYREEVIARGLDLVAGIVRDGIAAGEFRAMDPFLAARLFLAPLVLGALWQATFAPVEAEPVAPAALFAAHLDTFLRGLAPEAV